MLGFTIQGREHQSSLCLHCTLVGIWIYSHLMFVQESLGLRTATAGVQADASSGVAVTRNWAEPTYFTFHFVEMG